MLMKLNLRKPHNKYLAFASIRTYIFYFFEKNLISVNSDSKKLAICESPRFLVCSILQRCRERGGGRESENGGGGLEQLFDYLRGYICYSDKKGKKRKTVSEEGTEWALS